MDFKKPSGLHQRYLERKGQEESLFRRRADEVKGLALAGDKKAEMLYSLFLDYPLKTRLEVQERLYEQLGGDERKLDKFRELYLDLRSLFRLDQEGSAGRDFFNSYFATLVETGVVRDAKTLEEVNEAHWELMEKAGTTKVFHFISPLLNTYIIRTGKDAFSYGNELRKLSEAAEKGGIDFIAFYSQFLLPLLGSGSPRRGSGRPFRNGEEFGKCARAIFKAVVNEEHARLVKVFYGQVLGELQRSGKNGPDAFRKILSEALKKE